MKYWHRRIHLTLWILILPALVVVFVAGDRIIRQQQELSAVNATDDFFRNWEDELNQKKQDLPSEQQNQEQTP